MFPKENQSRAPRQPFTYYLPSSNFQQPNSNSTNYFPLIQFNGSTRRHSHPRGSPRRDVRSTTRTWCPRGTTSYSDRRSSSKRTISSRSPRHRCRLEGAREAHQQRRDRKRCITRFRPRPGHLQQRQRFHRLHRRLRLFPSRHRDHWLQRRN